MVDTIWWTLGILAALLVPVLLGRWIIPGPSRRIDTPPVTKPTILFAGVHVDEMGHLRLTEEVRKIEEVIRGAGAGRAIEVISAWEPSIAELAHAILACKPGIVHFSGHGTPEGELLFGRDGDQFVDSEALEILFSTLSKYVDCVVLNACHSLVHAERLNKVVDLVIGMRGTIEDTAAREFSFGFYGALAHGEDFSTAFRIGQASMKAMDPHADIPLMLASTHIDPSSMYLRAPVGANGSSRVK